MYVDYMIVSKLINEKDILYFIVDFFKCMPMLRLRSLSRSAPASAFYHAPRPLTLPNAPRCLANAIRSSRHCFALLTSCVRLFTRFARHCRAP